VADNRIKTYYRVTKPGIIYGNTIHVVAGYLLSFRFGLEWQVFFGVVLGVALVIASACVVNNYIDRSIDAHMTRTKGRAMVVGQLSVWQAMLYAVILGAIGMALLVLYTNITTVLLGVIAYIWYVWIYGYAKRTTWLSTVVGTVPGALPIMAGYVAGTNQIDSTAWLLFGLLFLWQLPHFYAIAIMRKDEYKNAGLPIITSRLSVGIIRRHIIVWTLLYIVSIVMLGATDAIHPIGTALLAVAALYWLWFMVAKYRKFAERKWAKQTFLLSLIMPIALLAASVLTVVLA
jgi:protoheme IX farnesyltransferase